MSPEQEGRPVVRDSVNVICSDSEEYLRNSPDRTGVLPAAIAQHLVTCEPCRTLARLDRWLASQLAGELPVPPDCVWDRIRERTRPGGPTGGRSALFPALIVGLVLVAAVIVLPGPRGFHLKSASPEGIAVQEPGGGRRVVTQGWLPWGSVLSTGRDGRGRTDLGSLQVELGGSTRVEIGSASRVRVLSGRADFLVERQVTPAPEGPGDGPAFMAELPGGRVEVEGAVFFLEVDRATRVAVVEGSVRACPDRGTPVRLEPGRELLIGKDGVSAAPDASSSRGPGGSPARVQIATPAGLPGRPAVLPGAQRGPAFQQPPFRAPAGRPVKEDI